MRTSGLALAMALVATWSPAAHADVLVVDTAGGGDFTSVKEAVTAAADGDTILIKPPGAFATFPVVVDAKSLTFVGDREDASDPVVWAPALVVRNLAAGQQVTLRNLSFTANLPSLPGLDLHDNLGAVWVEQCEVHGAMGSSNWILCLPGPTDPGGPGARVEDCASVTVTRSLLKGGAGANSIDLGMSSQVLTDGGPGAWIVASNVALHETEVLGGPPGGGFPLCGQGAVPGTGIELSLAQLLVAGGSVTGGSIPGPSVGGDGLHLDAGSHLQTLAATILGGGGGAADVVNAGGLVSAFPGSARSFGVDSPLREQEAGTLSMQGVQGDFVGFFWSFGAGSLPMPARNGWFVLDPSFLGGPFFLGFITDPGGAWDLPISAPLLLPGLEAQTFLLQAWFQYPGGVTLGSGTSLTLVDQAF